MANSPARAVVDVGSVIADTYTIEALLGRGGMGAVFLASHKRLAGKHVAIKILHTEIEDADVVARFKREAEIAAKLNHPNIVGVIDYNVAPDGMPYLVLDYLEGETLAQRIARGPLALEPMLSILRQIGSALAAAHRAGIVHRDLKPQNIFLVPTEVDGRVVEIAKVLDFGISKIRGSQTVKTQDSTLLGTPQYMAPEQATGQHALVDERTDVFALGAIVYEMLSGQPAFTGASIPEVVFKVVYEQPAPLAPLAPAATPAILAAVERAMAKPSDERFPTVTAFVEAITGQPLTLNRGQQTMPMAAAEAPSSSRRVTTREAFDQTMGPAVGAASAAAEVNPLLATAAPSSMPIPASTAGRGAAPSFPTGSVSTGAAGGSSSVATGSALGSPSAATPTVDGRAPSAPPAPHRSTGLIIAIALAAAALAAIAVYFATRTPAPAAQAKLDPPSPPPIAVVTPPAPPAAPTAPPAAPTAPPAAPTAPTTPPTTTAANTGAKAAAPKLHDPKLPVVVRPSAPAEDDGDPDTRDRLEQANAALTRRDYDAAERLANAVLNAPAGPRQHATARLIHGTVQCAARNDQEAAQIDLRGLRGFPTLRGRLLAACHSHGIAVQ
jgi:serine/threonine-protein kinase